MKKTIILSAVLILFITKAMGQEAIDTTILQCKYTFNHITNPEKNTGYIEPMTLDIGKNICKFYSEKQKLFDATMKKQIEDQMQNMGATRSISLKSTVRSGNFKTILFFNYPEKKITVVERITEFYEYIENIENINWQFFSNETKEILGYNCKKATCRFRGRDYEAWYAPDIPINKGPYKFSGLPGLILRITDTQDQIQFICESIEKIAVPILKEEYDGDVVKLNRDEYMRTEKSFRGNPMSILGQFSAGTATDANGNPLPPRKNLPYNPIELE
jgi:GLPGLI family protein